ncbi:MAG: aldehyde ferredoxin oxidoreductase C-terminal domain-containing protein, partial [bacterium]
LSAVTGIDFVSESLLEIGERVWNIERLFNLKEKFSIKDDTLPERFFQEDGGVDGRNINKDEFLASLLEYYRFRGWDREGVPTKEKLEQLNIHM